ncbi:hypothetical protein [Novimethylophilus kurashikiensis]|nr:hypothetical protein [Novimethylophilus kurashikiensis]
MMRAWLASSEEGEPEALLAACPTEWRAKIALLMRDLLARYPSTVIGAPVLLYIEPGNDPECLPPEGNVAIAHLPYPTRDQNQPCAELHFIGWLPTSAKLPVRLPFNPAHYDTAVPMNRIFAAVALFRSTPEVFDLENLELPNLWWGELFRPVAGNIQLSARMLLPYPDAIEAARVLEASANASTLPTRTGFLSDNGWAWATDAGILFNEQCRRNNHSEDAI